MNTDFEKQMVLRAPLNPGPQRQRFAVDLLRVDFADGVTRGGEVAFIDPSCIRVKVN